MVLMLSMWTFRMFKPLSGGLGVWQRLVGVSLPTMEVDTPTDCAQNLPTRTMLSQKIAFNKLHSSFMEILNGFSMENMDLK